MTEPLPPDSERVKLSPDSRSEAREAKHADAVRRAMQRILSSPRQQGAQRPPLPNWKPRFPRMLALDMNQWIHLARAHYGREPIPDAVAALNIIRRCVRSGKLIVPIASTNVLEAAEVSDEERRERLAHFMVDLSSNLSVVNHDVIALGECQMALMRKYKVQACFPIRGQLVHPGLAPVFGTRPRLKHEELGEIFDAVQEAPELSEFLLAHGLGEPRTDREIDRRALRFFKEIRESDGRLPIEERRQLEIHNSFQEGHIADLLYKAADEVGIARDALRTWLADAGNRRDLHDCIPSCVVSLELIVAGARNKDHVNDLKDYGFLKVVVPYANYVATEKFWAHILNVSGVARKYGTRVFGNLKELAQQLEADCGDTTERR